MLLVSVATALIFSGFTGAGDSTDERNVCRLLMERTAIMQRAAFRQMREADIYSELSKIEGHPLLRADMLSVSELCDSDTDRIVNMKITGCRTVSQKIVINFYEITVRWYMSGFDGYYTEDETYTVRAVIDDEKMKITGMEPA